MPGNQLLSPDCVSQTILKKILCFRQTAQNDLSIQTESIMDSVCQKICALVEEELSKLKNHNADLERQLKDKDELLAQKDEKITELEHDLDRSQAKHDDMKAALRKLVQEMSPSRNMGGRRELCIDSSDSSDTTSPPNLSSAQRQGTEPPHQLKRRRSSFGSDSGAEFPISTTKALRSSFGVDDGESTTHHGPGSGPMSSSIQEGHHASKIRRLSSSQELDLGAGPQKDTRSPEIYASGISTAPIGVDSPMDMDMKVFERDVSLPVIISSQIEMDTDALPLPLVSQQRNPDIPAANFVPQAPERIFTAEMLEIQAMNGDASAFSSDYGTFLSEAVHSHNIQSAHELRKSPHDSDMAAITAPAPTSAAMPAMSSLTTHTMLSSTRTPTIKKNNQVASDAMPTTMADMPVMNNMAAAEARTPARKEKETAARCAPWWADETAKASTTMQAGSLSATMPDVMVASASPIMAERSVMAPPMARNADMHMVVDMAPSLAKASAFMTPTMDCPLDLTSTTASPSRTPSISNGSPSCRSTDHVVLPIELDHVINLNFTNAVIFTQTNAAARLDEHKRASENALTRSEDSSSHASGLRECSSSLRPASRLAKDGSPRSLSDGIRHSNGEEGEASLEGNGGGDDRENQESTVSVRSSSTSTAFSTDSQDVSVKDGATAQNPETAKDLSLPPSPLLDHTALLSPPVTKTPTTTSRPSYAKLDGAALLKLYASRTNAMKGRKGIDVLRSSRRTQGGTEQQPAVPAVKIPQPRTNLNHPVSVLPVLSARASIPSNLPSNTAVLKPKAAPPALPSPPLPIPATSVTSSAAPPIGRYQVLPRIPKTSASTPVTTSTPLPTFAASCDDFGFPRRANVVAVAPIPSSSSPAAPAWSEEDLFVQSERKPDAHHDKARWREDEDISMVLFRILFALSSVSHGSVHHHFTYDVHCRICLEVVASHPSESFVLDDDLRHAVNDHCKTHKDAVSALRELPFLERQRAKRELEEGYGCMELQCSDSVSYVLLGDSNFDSPVNL